MPQLDIFDCGGQCAIYADGQLVYWDTKPSREQLLTLAGVAYTVKELPAFVMANVATLPKTVEELLRRARETEIAQLDAEILAAELRLAELKRQRGTDGV